MPSPAVNLERTDRLWSCLQVDGWDMKFNGCLHHFVLLVDEASGYAVIRELFRIPDDQSRNATGQEIIDTIQEAWIQYFGYPETVKMDLEGAHRSKKLREYFMEHGIDFVPAPAEHESIAQAERAIGSIRLKTEAFLRGSPGDAKQAAIAMIAATTLWRGCTAFPHYNGQWGGIGLLEGACWTPTTTRSSSATPPRRHGKSGRMPRRPSSSIVHASRRLEQRTPELGSTPSTCQEIWSSIVDSNILQISQQTTCWTTHGLERQGGMAQLEFWPARRRWMGRREDHRLCCGRLPLVA